MKKDLYLMRNLAIVFAVLLVLSGLALWLTAKNEEGDSEDTLYALNYSVSEIGGITVANAKGTFSLLSGQNGIELLSEEETSITAGTENLQAFYYNICHMPAIQQMEQNEDISFDPPAARLMLLSFAGERYSYTLSSTRGPEGEYYLLDDQTNVVSVLEESSGQLLLSTMMDFVSHQLVPAINQNNMGDIQEVSIVSKADPDAGYTIQQTSSGNVTGYRMTSPVNLRLDWETVLDQLIVPLSQLYPDAIVSTEGDLETYGLDQPDYQIQLTVAGQTSQALISQKDDAYYLTDGDGQVIGQLNEEQVRFLTQTYDQLLDHQLYPVDVRSISEIEAVTEQGSQTLTLQSEDGTVRASAGNVTLSSEDVPELATAFTDLPLASTATQEDVTGSAPALELTYTLTDGSRDNLRFWATQNGEYAVEYNGEIHFTTLASTVDALRNILSQF